VGRHDEEKLRRFVQARDAGDLKAARRWWGELVEDNVDRVRQFVRMHSRDNYLTQDEREDAVSLAFVKLLDKMVSTFQGSSMGEWVNATSRCAWYAVQDTRRAAVTRSGHEDSLDRTVTGEDGEERGRFEREEAAEARAAQERREDAADARDFLAWAFPRMKDERMRIVLERTRDGAPAKEIAEELGVSMNNLYKLRERGIKDLARLKEQWDA
jgi:RNA polymerase sigma factor (sigma-70 family)